MNNSVSLDQPAGLDHHPTVRSGDQAPNAWRVLMLLLLANLLNVYDRLIPAVLAEPMRQQFSLSDVHVGIVGTVFTLVYAIAGVPLGILADRVARRKLLAVGLAAWSAFTAFCGMATGFNSFLLLRVGVGIGEASLAPAATSLISDLFPRHKRSRALGIYMMGLPLGMVIGFVTVGALATALDSWRAVFLIAAIPGILVALIFLLIREPGRGATEPLDSEKLVTPARPLRALLRISAFWWIVVSGLGYNFAAYGVITFLVPLLQRYYQLSLGSASALSGAMVGVTGLIALPLGGLMADRLQRRWAHGRLMLCMLAMLLSAILCLVGLQERTATGFAIVFGAGWMVAYLYSPCIYPVIQDLVVPQMRATAMGTYFAAMYLLGAAFGSIAVGALSDRLAERSRVVDGALLLTDAHRAAGLHDALVLVPIALLVAAVACWVVTRQLSGTAVPRQGETP